MYAKPSPFVFAAFLQALASCETEKQVETLRERFIAHKYLLSPFEVTQGEETLARQLATIAAQRAASE